MFLFPFIIKKQFFCFIATCLSNLAFPKRCRDNDVLPSCVQIRHHLNRKNNADLFRRTSAALLRREIRNTRSKLNTLSFDCMHLHSNWWALCIPRLIRLLAKHPKSSVPNTMTCRKDEIMVRSRKTWRVLSICQRSNWMRSPQAPFRSSSYRSRLSSWSRWFAWLTKTSLSSNIDSSIR